MQVQSISQNLGFQGRRDNVDAIINLDDRTIQKASYVKAMIDTNDNKQRKTVKSMFFSIPLVAGIAGAILTPSVLKGKVTEDVIKNRSLAGVFTNGASAKAVAGLKHFAGWGAVIGVATAVIAGHRKLSQKSETVNKFDNKHPFVSIATTVAAGIGAMMLGAKGITMMMNKMSAKSISKLQNNIVKTANKINENKFIQSIMNKSEKLAAKTPQTLRNIGSVAMAWAPDALLIGALVNSCNHASKKDGEYINNYNEMKQKQLNLSKARLKELSKQNVNLADENKSLEKQNTALLDELSNKPVCPECEHKNAEPEINANKVDEDQVQDKVAEAVSDALDAIKEANETINED